MTLRALHGTRSTLLAGKGYHSLKHYSCISPARAVESSCWRWASLRGSPPCSGGSARLLQRETLHTNELARPPSSRTFCCSANRRSPESDKKKPILQQAAEVRKQLRSRITQNLIHENIYTLPNILTVSRLIATPIIGYLIVHEQHAWATGLLLYAGVTDLVDGWIARKWNLQTVVGTVIDPLADKALMGVLTICLAVQGGLPVWLATLILGRDASLAIAAIYYRYASLPPPKTLTRYWNFSLPSAEVHPTGVSKFNTFLQLCLLGATTALPVAGPAVNTFLEQLSSGTVDVDGAIFASQIIVASTTVWSGASYLWTKKAVKILGTDSQERKMRILVNGRLIIGASFLSVAGLALWLET